MQKWKTGDIVDISNEKSKHVGIEIGGAAPITLLFNVGSKDNVEEIINKLESSRDLARPSTSQESASTPGGGRFVAPAPQKSLEKGTVRFSPASPTIIPPREEEEEEEEEGEEEEHPSPANGHIVTPKRGSGEPAVALYEFTADGDDELTVAEGEELTVLEHDGDEWWKCRNTHGAEGVVPASYLELKAGVPKLTSQASAAQREDEEGDSGAAEAARVAQEAADRAEAARLQREEEERAAKERKKLEAQRRAKEAAVAAEAERQKRKEAAAAAAKRSPTPRYLALHSSTFYYRSRITATTPNPGLAARQLASLKKLHV